MHPNRPIRPGVILRREIEARDWSQTYLAGQLGWAISEVNVFLGGGRQVTERSAADLSRVLGTSSEFWLALEKNYRENLERICQNKTPN
jgi:HTH-type transcriptional regulator/antitoxin HigA